MNAIEWKGEKWDCTDGTKGARNEREGAFTHIHAAGGGEEGVAAMKKKLAALGVTELRPIEVSKA